MFTRRQFLIGVLWSALLRTKLKPFTTQDSGSDLAAEFDMVELDTLAAVMDELIPAGNDMPAASATGGREYLQYLAWQYPAIREEIHRFVQLVVQESVIGFRQGFRSLYCKKRQQILRTIEERQPAKFWSFVGYVYESYYANPKVLGLLWCPSPISVKEDYELLLAPVQKLTHMYREIP